MNLSLAHLCNCSFRFRLCLPLSPSGVSRRRGGRAKSLLSTEGGHVFDTFRGVVDNGEYIKHFHVYKKESNDAGARDETETVV